MNDVRRPEELTPAALQARLRSAVFGHRVFYYPSILSTNDRALELSAAGEPEGAAVLAEEQTGGRGRRDRGWHSPARLGIYVSLILRPLVPAPRAPLFTFAAAVAVCGALREETGVQAAIKWPNDVLAGRRKIAGILAETRGSEPVIRDMVLGIGVNVGQRADDLQPDIRERATSVLLETGRPADRAALLAAILERLERTYGLVVGGRSADLLAQWTALSALPDGHAVVVQGPGGRVSGRVAGVDEEGGLRLLLENGRTMRVPFGEIIDPQWG